MEMIKITAAAIGILMLFCVWLLMLNSPAKAHEAPSGWTYDFSCCNTRDCRPADGPNVKNRHHPVQIEEVTGGYRISTTREVVPWNDKRVRESKDGDYHVCTIAGADDQRALCIYVPMRGV